MFLRPPEGGVLRLRCLYLYDTFVFPFTFVHYACNFVYTCVLRLYFERICTLHIYLSAHIRLSLHGILFFHPYSPYHNALAVDALFILDMEICVGQQCSVLIQSQPGGIVAAGRNGGIQCAVHQLDGIIPDHALGIIRGTDIQARAAVGRQRYAAAKGDGLGVYAAVVKFHGLGPGAAAVCGTADIAGHAGTGTHESNHTTVLGKEHMRFAEAL